MSDQQMPTLSFTLAKTNINIAITEAGLNYQKLLQEAEDIAFTADNLDADYESLKKLKKVKTLLDKMVNPHTAAWQEWNAANASIYNPVEEVIKRKTEEFKKVRDDVAAENKKKKDEEDRKANIKAAISTFTLDYSTKIANALTNDELVVLQKRIGAEKSRSTYYQEFMPDLFEAVEGLENAMKKQKEHIKGLQALQEAKKEAEKTGDDETLMEILDKEAEITEKIEETRAQVQEQAVDRSIAHEPSGATVVLTSIPKAAKTVWSWEIVDMEAFGKRYPGLVTMTANKQKIDDMIRELKANETIAEGVTHGLKIYKKEHF